MKAKEMLVILSVFIVQKLHYVKLSSNDTHFGGVVSLHYVSVKWNVNNDILILIQ